MRFVCPNCTGIIQAEVADFGNKIKCEKCNQEVDVPSDYYTPGVIINDFQIEREIAHGGMGIVFKAKQLSLDRIVALKILMSKYTEDIEFVKQFIQEARAAAKLNHPNVVQAYMVGEEGGTLFFAMEYIDGMTMKQVLAQEKKIEVLRATKIIRDIAEALEFAWQEFKIVHQDIKPDNIMITSKGKAKLADLGLAKTGDKTMLDIEGDEVFGTPQYICPEQLYGQPTDIRSDIYSLGATFYHMIVGDFAYTGADANEIAKKHVSETLVPPKERNSSIPERVSNVIVKMMEKEPEKRYQTAVELIKELTEIINNFDKLGKETSVPASTSVGSVPKISATPPKLTKTPPVIGLKKKEEAQKAVEVQAQEPKKEESKGSEEVKASPPKIGLKKREEPPKPEPPKVQAPAKEKKEDKKTEDKKSGDKKQDTKDKNNKKKVAPEEKKSNIGVVVVIVVILALIGGGVWYKWEYVKSFFVKSGANQEVSTSVVVKPKTPVKPKVEQPPAPKRTYLEELQQLKTFIAQNPQKENEFLLDFDIFLKKYPLPQNTEERMLFAEVIKIFNIIDERLRVEPRREILLKEHEREITLREEILRQAEEAEQQKKITEARIAEDARKKMELEAARMSEELRLKEEENRIRAEYAQKLSPALDEMRRLFNLACRDISKKADLQNYVNKIRDKYPLRDYAITKELEVQNEVINFGKSLLANVDKTNRMYKVFVGRDNKFIDLQFSKVVMLAVRDVNFEKHNLKVEVLKNGKIHNYSLDKEENREIVFKKVVEKNKNLSLKELEFYYHFFFDFEKSKLQSMALDSFWRTFFTKIL